MTLREKIECMEAFERGEEIEYRMAHITPYEWDSIGDITPSWNWDTYNYRIKPKPKQVVVIEKWLIYDNLSKSYSIAEESNIEEFLKDDRAYLSKVKLLDTYEVTL